MAANGKDKPDDLDALIAESEREEVAVAASDDELIASVRPVRHPVAVFLAWLVLGTVGMVTYLNPLPKQHDLGIRSVETRVSIAMYHVAHRVETYRRFTGHLPEFLDPHWHEAGTVEYQREDDRYRLVGREGQFALVYNDGDDAERLLHYTFLKLGGQ